MVGTVNVEAGGRSYALRFSMRAMLRYQELYGEPFVEAADKFAQNPGDMTLVVKLFRVALVEDLSEDQALDLMDEIGVGASLRHVTSLVLALQSDLFGQEEEAPSGNAKSPLKKAG
jgi:hypothetical protein